MNSSNPQIVKPSGKGRESSFVFLFASFIVITSALLISINHKPENVRHLLPSQISAFKNLNEQELAVFNALYTSAIEIDEIHDDEDGIWLNIPQLQEEILPPFVQDSAWEKNGKYSWTRILKPSGSIDVAIYAGQPARNENCGSFLLFFLHDHALSSPTHAPYEIWYHPSPAQKAPFSVTDQALQSSGWKEVIALSGEDEVKRIKG